MQKPEFKPGIWKHYKGDLYHALCLVKHHDSREDYVLYFSLKYGSANIRPLHGSEKDPDGFLDILPEQATQEEPEGHCRFTYVGPPGR